jgi:hypothetical protein
MLPLADREYCGVALIGAAGVAAGYFAAAAGPVAVTVKPMVTLLRSCACVPSRIRERARFRI